MEHTREIIEISSDEDEASESTARGMIWGGAAGAKKERSAGGGNDLPGGASPAVADEDECLILDRNPQSAEVGEEFVDLGNELSDEMLIVGEKGQFACRDYPHPRYLCATFLFSMTPHKKHCYMCHCYVCDCLAPCSFWESHCSSTHKDHGWRVERQLFRRRKKEQHALKLFDTKPAFACPSKPVLKSSPSLLSQKDDPKSIHHDVPIQSSYNKQDIAGPNQSVSNSAQSLLPSNEPKSENQHNPLQFTRRRRFREPPYHSTEIAANRPKDILCEIYKICPIVISCRRRIPPSLQPDELSDNEQDV